MSAGVKSGVFCDWITITQFHPQGGLPLLVDGVHATFDALGNCRSERAIAQSYRGSYDTAVRVRCDGFRVSLSGNVGRLSRPDNLFNLGWSATLAKCDRILVGLGLPPFSSGEDLGPVPEGSPPVGAFVSRLDLTCNYSAGSDAQARAVIRWLAGRSVARMKRGYSGDASVWFSNTRHMLKAYRKGAEMIVHGMPANDPLVQFAQQSGLVRVEVELKKRLLSELGLNRLPNITDEALEAVFHEQTEVFRRVDMSEEPDIIANIPARSRAYASAWMAGQDVRLLCSQATLYRHAKVLREYGIDILEPRNIEHFPVKVRVIDLQPMPVPDWYDWREVA